MSGMSYWPVQVVMDSLTADSELPKSCSRRNIAQFMRLVALSNSVTRQEVHDVS